MSQTVAKLTIVLGLTIVAARCTVIANWRQSASTIILSYEKLKDLKVNYANVKVKFKKLKVLSYLSGLLSDCSDVGVPLQLILSASQSECNPRGFPPITPVRSTAAEGATDVNVT